MLSQGGTKQISSHLQRHVESALLLYHGEYLWLQSCSSAREQGQALSIRALLDMTRKLLLRKSDTQLSEHLLRHSGEAVTGYVLHPVLFRF